MQLACLLLLLAGACTSVSQPEDNGRRVDFTTGWTFNLGDDESASAPDYDDSGWRKLNLPHDWAIEGDFLKTILREPEVELCREVLVGIVKCLRLIKLTWVNDYTLILTVYI